MANCKFLETSLGFAITLPVYEDGIVPISLEQRRDKIIGYLAGVYSLEELTKSQTGRLVNEGFNLEISDQIDNENRLSLAAGPASKYTQETEINAYGSSFYLTLTASTDFTNNQSSFYWVFVQLLP